MKNLQSKTSAIPDNFYSVLIFKSKITERKLLLEEVQRSLQNRFKADYTDLLIKTIDTTTENDFINNYIFITEPDRIKSAITSGNVEATIYCNCLNYKKLLFSEFHEEFIPIQQHKQEVLF